MQERFERDLGAIIAKVNHYQFDTRRADLSKMRPVEYVWNPWIPRGRLTEMVGEEKIGKSTFQAHVAARITRGQLPGIFEGKPGKVLFVGADEDDWSTVTLPRLVAAGADMALIEEFFALDAALVFDAEKHSGELWRLLGNEYALVVFEHLMDILPAMKNYNDPAALRRVVRPLRRARGAADTGGLGTRNVNKAQAQRFRQRAQGSMQWGAMARSAFLIDRHPDDPQRRVAVLGPANYVRDDKPHSLSFAITDHMFVWGEHPYSVGRVADIEATNVSMEDVLTGGESDRDRRRREQREAVLDALTEEPQSVREIAVAAGVPKSTVQNILLDLEVEHRAQRAEDSGWIAAEE